jgi:hypothetical protein
MARQEADNTCRRMRARLYTAMNKHFGPETHWARSHIQNCPRCQRRLVSSGKVYLALSFVKAQPHGVNLLMRANKQAVSVLKHSLRQEPKAQELKTKLPEPKPLDKYVRYGFSIGSLAACIAILILMKIGVFSSIDTVQNKGRKVIKQYYVRQVGRDLANEVFPLEPEASTADPQDPAPA